MCDFKFIVFIVLCFCCVPELFGERKTLGTRYGGNNMKIWFPEQSKNLQGASTACECEDSSRVRRNCVWESSSVLDTYRKCSHSVNIDVPFWLREKDPSAKYGGCFIEADVDAWEKPAARKCWSQCVWERFGLLNRKHEVSPTKMSAFVEKQLKGIGKSLPSNQKMELEKCIRNNSTISATTSPCQAAFNAHLCWWFTVWSGVTGECMQTVCQWVKK